ncbi:MAG TPA: hypothetical protein VKC60_00395 [Opitutaceae bacterium]|nr:hypothetical protein [Opitutaceae bacterium]
MQITLARTDNAKLDQYSSEKVMSGLGSGQFVTGLAGPGGL